MSRPFSTYNPYRPRSITDPNDNTPTPLIRRVAKPDFPSSTPDPLRTTVKRSEPISTSSGVVEKRKEAEASSATVEPTSSSTTTEKTSPTLATSTVSPPTSFVSRLATFAVEVAQWQRPFASALYLMMANTVFWLSVFYIRAEIQHKFLLSVASIIILAEITQSVLGVGEEFNKIKARVQSTRTEFAESQGWQTVRLIFFSILTLAPIRFLLRPPFEYLIHIFGDKLDQLLIAILSTAAAHFIEADEKEYACWAAYATASVFVISPPWRFNKIGETIIIQVNQSVNQSIEVADRFVLQPTKRVSITACTWLKYIILFEWLPTVLEYINVAVLSPTVKFVKFVCKTIRDAVILVSVCTFWIIFQVITKIANFFIAIYEGICALIRGIIHTFLRVVYGIINAVKYTVNTFVNVVVKIYTWIHDSIVWIYTSIRSAIVKTYTTIRDVILYIVDTVTRWSLNTYYAVTYVIFGYWIPPLIEYVQRKTAEAKDFAHRQWLLPIGVHLQNLRNGIIYVVCGHWLPLLGAYLDRNVVAPVKIQLEKGRVLSLKAWVQIKLLSAYIFYGVWLRDLGRVTLRYSIICGRWTHREIVRPVWSETKLQSYNVAVWTKEVITPAWLLLTEMHVIEPMSAWIESKMPYQDDRDIADFVPATHSRGGHSRADSDVDSVTASLSLSERLLKPASRQSSTTGFTPDQRNSYAQRHSSQFSNSDGEFALDGDDFGDDPEFGEFTRGLKFTRRAHVDSDSSDDEFSLRTVVKQKKRPPKTSHVRQVVQIPPEAEKSEIAFMDTTPTTEVAQMPKTSSVAFTPTSPMMAEDTTPHTEHSPSPESSTTSWSETLLQAYRKKKEKKLEEHAPNPKDNEFEVLEK